MSPFLQMNSVSDVEKFIITKSRHGIDPQPFKRLVASAVPRGCRVGANNTGSSRSALRSCSAS
jgi:hypothetical protein